MQIKQYIKPLLAAGLIALPLSVLAQDVAEAVADPVADALGSTQVIMDTLWTIVAAILVFWMQAGFAYVEGGFTRAKNTNNIMMKNFLSIAIGTLAYMAIGWAIMFGDGNAFMGTTGWFLAGADNSPLTGDAYVGVYSAMNWAGIPLAAKVAFQLMFAATAGTIISGCAAERIKFGSYIVATVVVTAVVYPVVGHWAWGGGWLGSRDVAFTDFAGSTVVHLVGGTLACTAAIALGARRGKYVDGKPRAIPGHSMPMATLGVFILWMGWFGFNAGSTMGATADIGVIVLNTNVAAAAGVVGALIVARIMFGTFDIGMSLNGALAGLVGITAGCLAVSTLSAMIIGLIAGVLVVFAVVIIDKIGIDDPVGAISVHGVCGAFGTLAVGFAAIDGGLLTGGGAELLVTQLMGVAATIVWCGVAGFTIFYGLKFTIGLRVSVQEEEEGLDLGEHGLPAYPGGQAPGASAA